MGETGDRSAILMPSCPTLSLLFLFVSLKLRRVVTTESDKTTSNLHSRTENGQVRQIAAPSGRSMEAPIGCVQQCLVLPSGQMLFLHPLSGLSG